MILSYLAIAAYLAAALLLARYFTKDEIGHRHQQTTSLLISLAIITQALNFTDFGPVKALCLAWLTVPRLLLG